MSDSGNNAKSMEEIMRETMKETDKKLQNELEALHAMTREDLEGLFPDTTDKETLDRLIAAVDEAREKNESRTELAKKLVKIGGKVLELGKAAAGRMPGM